VSFAGITLCVASRRVFVVVYLVIVSVRKLLDTPSYTGVEIFSRCSGMAHCLEELFKNLSFFVTVDVTWITLDRVRVQ